MTSEGLLREAETLRERVLQERRELHRHAETGFELKETLPFVKSELTGMGLRPVECGRAGLVALVGGKKPGKVFLLRADMDGLPIREESGVDFACPN
ncbi:MAG: amidohydrolase, partial [Oscillospiraceae bacterium]|nr:amidohydrolase [Oscillospiraceae bacterium]MDY5736139.1 amidohydrolase [Oscillospiraceae bacterium]